MTPAAYASGVEVSNKAGSTLSYPALLVSDSGDNFVHYMDNIYLLFDDGRDSLDDFSAEYDFYDVYLLMDDMTLVNANNMDEYTGRFTWRWFEAWLAFPDGTLVYDEPVTRVYLNMSNIAYIGGRVEVSVVKRDGRNVWDYVVTVYNGTGDVTGQASASLSWTDDSGVKHYYYPADGYTYTIESPVTWITSDNYADIVSATGTLITNIVLTKVETSPIEDIAGSTTATELPTGPAGELDDLDGQLSDLTPTLPEWDEELPGDDTASALFAYLYESTWIKQMMLTVSVVALCAFVIFGRRG